MTSFVTLPSGVLASMCERTKAKVDAQRAADRAKWDAIPWYWKYGPLPLLAMVAGVGFDWPMDPALFSSYAENVARDLARAASLAHGRADDAVRVSVDDLSYLEDPE